MAPGEGPPAGRMVPHTEVVMFDFKALFHAWRGQGVISEMFARFQEMLEDAGEMLGIACRAIENNADVEEEREKLRALDKQVNRAQRAIRRQVVEHLSVNQGVDVPASLVLMSIVKDAERLGDYARDIFEAVQYSPEAALEPRYSTVLREVASQVTRLLADTRKALADSDEPLAMDIMEREGVVKDMTKSLLDNLSKDALPSHKTVTLTLMAWYFRRLTAHTANIASSITNPIERLDYKPRPSNEQR